MFRRTLTYGLAPLTLLAFGVGMLAAADKPGETHTDVVVSISAGEIVMTDQEGKNEHTHTVAEDALITLNGKSAKLMDLKKGHFVKVTTKDGDPTVAIKIEASTAKPN